MRWSLQKAAQEFGVTRETVRRALARDGVEVGRGNKAQFTTKQIVGALFGDLYRQRARREKAEADISEREAAEMKRDLIRREEAASFIRATFMPVREQVLALPALMAAKCNPSDPQHARAHLEGWRDMFLRVCKEKMP